MNQNPKPKPNPNEVTGRFKKIWERTDQQLEINIQSAIDDCKQFGLDFYVILTGIDAYQEKRRRKEGITLAIRPLVNQEETTP